MDYNNEEDYDAYLPKRSNEIYKEIESFEEYELTQCVAYEMAVRNENISTLLHIVDNDISENMILEKNTNILKLYNYGFDAACVIYYILVMRQSVAFNYDTNKIDVRFDTNMLLNNNNVAGIDYADGKLFKTSIKNDYGKREIDSIAFNEIIKGYIPFISFALKRPLLQFETSKIFNLEINLALPKYELLKYLEEIKKEHDTNHDIFKTPIEILNNKELQKAIKTKEYPKKPDAKKYADMFFIYDYLTVRYEEVKQHNAEQKKKYDDDILNIKNNTDLSTKEKRELKKQALNEYKQMKSDATIKDICHEDELTEQLDIKGDMIYKYYLAIKPYIEELKYKELITGVQAE